MKLTSILPASALALLLTACGPQAPATPETAASETTSPTTSEPAGAPASSADTAPAAATAANADAGSAPGPDGKAIYNRTCALCHATGTAGAPKPGDKADLEPRLAQGMEVIHKHAIEGCTGTNGVMPARGGAASLTDDEVNSAAEFIAGVFV